MNETTMRIWNGLESWGFKPTLSREHGRLVVRAGYLHNTSDLLNLIAGIIGAGTLIYRGYDVTEDGDELEIFRFGNCDVIAEWNI